MHCLQYAACGSVPPQYCQVVGSSPAPCMLFPGVLFNTHARALALALAVSREPEPELGAA
jgi:hypothetical protein